MPDANPLLYSLSAQRDICRRAFLCTGWAFWDRKWIHLFQSKYRGAWNHKGSTFLVSITCLSHFVLDHMCVWFCFFVKEFVYIFKFGYVFSHRNGNDGPFVFIEILFLSPVSISLGGKQTCDSVWSCHDAVSGACGQIQCPVCISSWSGLGSFVLHPFWYDHSSGTVQPAVCGPQLLQEPLCSWFLHFLRSSSAKLPQAESSSHWWVE